MSWKVSIAKIADVNRRAITLTYSDGKRSVQESFDVQGGFDVQRVARHKIEWLEAQDALFDEIVEGPVEIVPVVVEPDKPPSQDQLDQQAFTADYQKLKQLTALAEKGVLDADAQAIVDLQTSLKENFKPEYADIL